MVPGGKKGEGMREMKNMKNIEREREREREREKEHERANTSNIIQSVTQSYPTLARVGYIRTPARK